MVSNHLMKLLQEAVSVLRRGGVVAFPTETTYGLGCDPRNVRAVKKIFLIKGRKENKPLQLIASSFLQVNAWAELSSAEKMIAKKYWPGPLTLLVKLREGNKLAPQVCPERVIGIRISSGTVVRRLARAFGFPIAATSANPSGLPPARSGREVERVFRDSSHKPDFIIDDDRLPKRKPSTVARVRQNGEVEIFRQGAIRL